MSPPPTRFPSSSNTEIPPTGYAGNPPPAISALPIDILEAVFSEFILTADPAQYPGVTLIAVCRCWHNITLESPRLWSTIFIATGPGATSSIINWAKRYIALAEEAPLRLIWRETSSAYHPGTQDDYDMSEWIYPYLPQCRFIKTQHLLRWQTASLVSAMEKAGALPALRRIVLRQQQSRYRSRYTLYLGFKAPHLRNLTLANVGGLDIASLLNLLQETPLLTTADFSLVAFQKPSDDERDLPIVDARRVQTWSFNCGSGVPKLLEKLDISPISFTITEVYDEIPDVLPLHIRARLGQGHRDGLRPPHTHLRLEADKFFTTRDSSGRSVHSFGCFSSRRPFLELGSFDMITDWWALTTLHVTLPSHRLASHNGEAYSDDVVLKLFTEGWTRILIKLSNLEIVQLGTLDNEDVNPISTSFFLALAPPALPLLPPMLPPTEQPEAPLCPRLYALTLQTVRLSRNKNYNWGVDDAEAFIGMLSYRKRVGIPLSAVSLRDCIIFSAEDSLGSFELEVGGHVSELESVGTLHKYELAHRLGTSIGIGGHIDAEVA